LKYRPPPGLVSRWIGLGRPRSEDSVVLVRLARSRALVACQMAYLIPACITAADRAVPCRSDVAIFGEVGAMVLSAAAARTPESQVGCTGNLSSVEDHAGRGCGGNPPPFSGRKASVLAAAPPVRMINRLVICLECSGAATTRILSSFLKYNHSNMFLNNR